MTALRELLLYAGLGSMIVISVALSYIAAAPMLQKPAEKTGTDYVSLTIAVNPVNGLDQYFPANFTVESGVPTVITITNYDTGTNVVPGMPANTSHTFTIPSLHVSISVPAALGDNEPSVTSFTISFTPGHYTWLCLAPCDPSSMGTSGYMSGTVTAV